MRNENRIGVSDFILKCWGIDGTGWTFEFVSDGWWELTARSESLGEFRANSWADNDVEETLGELLKQIENEKKELEGQKN